MDPALSQLSQTYIHTSYSPNDNCNIILLSSKFSWGFWEKYTCIFYFHMNAPCPAHLFFIDLTILARTTHSGDPDHISFHILFFVCNCILFVFVFQVIILIITKNYITFFLISKYKVNILSVNSCHWVMQTGSEWRVPSSGIWIHVNLVRADISEECITFFFRVERICKWGAAYAVG
jgi:hypothetical protein